MDSILLEVLLDLLAAGAGGPLFSTHGAAHDDGADGVQGQPAQDQGWVLTSGPWSYEGWALVCALLTAHWLLSGWSLRRVAGEL